MMFKNVLSILLVFMLSTIFSSKGAEIYIEGEVIVKFKSTVSKAQLSSSVSMVEGAKVLSKLDLKDGSLYKIKLPPNISVRDAIKMYSLNPNVEYAEPNYKVKKVSAEVIPNDPFFGFQWGLRNIGGKIEGFDALAGADIKASYSWQFHKGGDIVVAVIDTGVDYNHPDLKANIWINNREICDNGIDDDKNGYIDDCYGWNFVYNNNNPFDDDTEGHGTHVAGIIGAVGNNGIGVTGINWKIKIMPLKFLDKNGEGDIYSVVKAINYAVDMGAKIINASYAYPSTCIYTEPSRLEIDVLKKAEQSGVIVVAAAGNYGCDNDKTPIYPASHKLSNIISVTASDMRDSRPYWAGYGIRSVHLAAPGFKIYSTVPNGKYTYLTGTSMATPFVTGAAAFLLTYRPDYNTIKVREVLLSSVDVVDAFSKTVSGGRLNLYKALTMDNIYPVRPVIFSVKSENNLIYVYFQDNSYMEEGFIVKKGTSPNNLSQVKSLPPMAGAYNTQTYEDRDIVSGNTYYYQICSFIADKLSCSNIVSSNYTVNQPASQPSTTQSPAQTSNSSSGGCKLIGTQTVLVYMLLISILILIRKTRDIT